MNRYILDNFVQISLEIHNIEDIFKKSIIENTLIKLRRLSYISHIHCNNCCLNNTELQSNVLELLLINKRYVSKKDNKIILRNNLDNNNVNGEDKQIDISIWNK